MRQLIQEVDSGELRLVEVPEPEIGPTEVLVATSHSVLSAGTERAARSIATASLLGKARARPDLVRQVVRKARAEGLGTTVRAVRARLSTDMPLGYSAAGIVVQVGEAVVGVVPGQRVATGGAGHADLQVVHGPLAVPIPGDVPFAEAAFSTIGAIAIHGLRLADVGPGAKVCVIGLGLLGQLTARIAMAAGCDVAGIDLREWAVERARQCGVMALVESGEGTTSAVLDWTKGRGVDAIMLTAATPSSDPARRAPAIARDRATVVVVGDVGLQLERTPLYEKEITLRFARSYGPGRYERSYEEWAVDYPLGHVRWTEGRNLESFLDLLKAGRLSVKDLVTHTFPLEQASDAYALISNGAEHFFGVELTYAGAPETSKHIYVSPRTVGGDGVGLIGAGNFAKGTLVPGLKQAGFARLVAVASASGLSAVRLAKHAGFEKVETASDLIADPEVKLVVIATRHDTHDVLATEALSAGKHVFCEKPLAITRDGLERVASAWRANSGCLMVGFNRRYAPAVRRLRQHFGSTGGPLVLTYRVNAGSLPDTHWYLDRRQGGRLIGEVCHFIDTCSFIVGEEVASVICVGCGRGEALLQQDVVVTLRYADGSLATISYASGGHSSTPKERIEVLGRGRSALIDDFRRLVVDGKSAKVTAGDKGHTAEMAILRRLLVAGEGSRQVTMLALQTMSATLAAAESLISGVAVSPPPV